MTDNNINLTAIKPQSFPRIKHMYNSPGRSPDDIRSDKDWFNSFSGKYIIITEKLDGENTGITNISCYARSKIPTLNPWSVNIRRDIFPFVKDLISDDEIVFGENLYAIHSIKYNHLSSYFHIFAVYNTKLEVWYSWSDVEMFAKILDLPTVPVLFKGIINSEKDLMDKINYWMSQPSAYGVEKEGVVMRLTGEIKPEDWNNSIVKYVRANHVQTNKRWEDDWERAELVVNNNNF
jgi:hypothetical protein